MVAYKDRAGIRLASRRGIDHATRYPNLAAAIAQLARPTLVLDGQLAIFGDWLRSRFDWLRLNRKTSARHRRCASRSICSAPGVGTYSTAAPGATNAPRVNDRRRHAGIPP